MTPTCLVWHLPAVDAPLHMATPAEVTVTTTMAGGKPPLLPGFKDAAAAPITIKKAVLVYNPVSGNKKGKRRAEGIVAPMMREAGVEVVMLPTERAGHAVELAKTCDLTGVDALLALGGDGTLSDVATGLLQREAGRGNVVLGFIPSGTGNTLVHEILGTRPKPPKDDAFVRLAVETILGGRVRKMDCCKVRDTPAISCVAVGLWLPAAPFACGCRLCLWPHLRLTLPCLSFAARLHRP